MNAADFLVALEQQLNCYRKLLKLAGLQRGYIEQNQTDALIAILQERQASLTEISALEQIVGPIKRAWGEQSASFDKATRAACQTAFTEARALLQQITQSDQDDVLLLQQRKLNVGKQLQQTKNARQVNRTYAAAAYGSPKSALNVKS